MDVHKFVLKETGIIAVGQGICVAVMLAVFALIGKFDMTVLFGGIIGAVIAVLNFFFMAIGVDAAADRASEQDIKGGKAKIRSSYLLRILLLFVGLFVLVKSGWCNPFALVVPLAFVRPTITVAEFFRKTGKKDHEC